jgi:hypothetical protein
MHSNNLGLQKIEAMTKLIFSETINLCNRVVKGHDQVYLQEGKMARNKS